MIVEPCPPPRPTAAGLVITAAAPGADPAGEQGARALGPPARRHRRAATLRIVRTKAAQPGTTMRGRSQ